MRNQLSGPSNPVREHLENRPLSHRSLPKIRRRPNPSAILREEHLIYL
jgi:hypothetical protein